MSKENKYILAIDQGTTGSRAILYNKKGEAIASSYKEFTQYFPTPGWVEHDPIDILESVYSSVKDVIRKNPSKKIIAIGITNQRETTVLWDKVTGKPVYNAIVWQCRRTAKRCDQIKKNVKSTREIYNKTGLPVDAYFSASKIEWIIKNVKDARVKIKEKRLLFGTTDSWILWNLTGGLVHATDYTNASRTMLFNINSLSWDKDLLKLFNVPVDILPHVRSSSNIFGYTKQNKILPDGIPICGIAGDQQASLFGQTCFSAGDVKNTYGTGAFLLLNTGSKRIYSKNGLITTLGCFVDKEPVYVLEGAVFIAGAAIQWLRDGLNVIKNAIETENIANSISSNDGVYFVPAFVGLGAPHWNQHSRGTITGITRGTTKAHLVRAALEAMCYQTKDVMSSMEADSSLKIKSLRIDGGAVRNNFLCQFQADILQKDIIRPKVIETTSLGAAYLAGLCVGYWKDLNDIKKNIKQDRIFSPKIRSKQSQILYNGWQRAVGKTIY